MLVSTVRIEAGSPATPFTNLHRGLHLRPLSRRQTGGGTADWRNHPATDGTTGRAAMTSAASGKLGDRLIVLWSYVANLPSNTTCSPSSSRSLRTDFCS